MKLWIRARNAGLPNVLRELSGETLQLVIERPAYWEYRLYGRVLKEKLSSLSHLKRDWELGIISGTFNHIATNEIFGWITSHNSEIIQKLSVINTLFRSDVVEGAFGAPGSPGDPDQIVYIADRLASYYRDIIEWSIHCRRIVTDQEFEEILRITGRSIENTIREIEQFSENFEKEMSELVNNPPRKGETRQINATLTLTYPEEVERAQHEELRRLAKKFGLPFNDFD
jgi:hypothetical protein